MRRILALSVLPIAFLVMVFLFVLFPSAFWKELDMFLYIVVSEYWYFVAIACGALILVPILAKEFIDWKNQIKEEKNYY